MESFLKNSKDWEKKMEWSESKKIVDGLINRKQEAEVVLLAKKESSINGLGDFVGHVLGNPNSSEELINGILQAYLDKKGVYNFHGWAHRLTHFIRKLWEKRLTDWIKKFYEVAIEGNQPYNENADYTDRLARCFCDYAEFDDNPVDFHLTCGLRRWSELSEHHRERIQTGVFQSANELSQWKLLQEINGALKSAGSQSKRLESPNYFPEYRSLQGKSIALIDDAKEMADIFLPHLIVATGKWVEFIHHTTQSQSELVREINNMWRPDILLVDWGLAMGINGGNVIRELKKTAFAGTIIGFSSEKRNEFVDAGASGSAYKNTSRPEESIRALGALMQSINRE